MTQNHVGLYRGRKSEEQIAGFGAIFNECVEAIYWHFKAFGDYQVQIRVPAFEGIFEISQFSDTIADGDVVYDLRKVDANTPTHGVSNAHKIGSEIVLREKANCTKAIFRFRDAKEFDQKLESMFEGRILGVHLRGTDKVTEVVPPSIKSVSKQIERLLREYSIDKIFLATDDSKYIRALTKRFGDKLVFNQSSKKSRDGFPIHFGSDRKLMDRQVAEDVYLLANCDVFLYSLSNVSYMALLFGLGKFEAIEPTQPQNEDTSKLRHWLNRDFIRYSVASFFRNRVKW